MMRGRLRFLLALLPVAGAFGQRYEIGPAGGYTRFAKTPLGSVVEGDNAGENSRLKGKQSYGARLTWNTKGYYGHEITYMRGMAEFSSQVPGETSGRLQRNSNVTTHEASYNALAYFMPAGERWRPFLTGGIEMIRLGKPRIPEWTSTKFRTYGGNYGGGIKLMPFKRAIVRLDVRQHITGKPYNLHFAVEDPTRGLKQGGFYKRLDASIGISIGF